MAAGIRRLLVVAPTGSGKTVLAVRMLSGAVKNKKRCLFIVHRRELVRQSLDAFEAGGVPCGVIANGKGFKYEAGYPVYVASIQTLVNRLYSIGDFDMCIWDEAHHLKAKSWDKVFRFYKNAWHCGLTASPERLDGGGLRDFFDEMVMGPSVSELMKGGSLCKYAYYSSDSDISLDDIRMVAGDYSPSAIGDLMDVPVIVNKAVDEYLRLAPDKRFLVFAVNLKHSQHIVDEFQRKGISALHIDSKTPQEERDAAILGLSEGRIKVISNVGLFGEGVDIPVLDGISILRPTKSLALYLQMCGRCLRPSPGKDKAIIIDHVMNFKEHGLPCDDRRDSWSLDGREKREIASTRICEFCFRVMQMKDTICPACKTPVKINKRGPRGGPEEVEGEIVKIDPEEVRRERHREVAQAETLDDLVRIGIQRGYKTGWAYHILAARQRKLNKKS